MIDVEPVNRGSVGLLTKRPLSPIFADERLS